MSLKLGIQKLAFFLRQRWFSCYITAKRCCNSEICPSKNEITDIPSFKPVPKFSGHPGGCCIGLKWKMNYIRRCKLPFMSKNSKNPDQQRNFKLLKPEGNLENISIDIIGPLPRKKREKDHVVDITDSYRKLNSENPSVEYQRPTSV